MVHREPFICLAGVTHNSALITWGAFFFKVDDDGEFHLLEDKDLRRMREFPKRNSSIGAASEPYDPDGRVEIFDSNNNLVSVNVTGANHCFVTGLAPATDYRYRIIIEGAEWGSGRHLDWDAGRKGLVDQGGKYTNVFRTMPDPKAASPEVSFAVLGDFGNGVKKISDKKHQREIADALLHAVDQNEPKIRLILTTGDNIYGRLFGADSGDHDDDWFFTFYQPYRYVINRVPVYPAIGNHDSEESEERDDRAQVYDNFFIPQRVKTEFSGASVGPGLFYRFRFGADIEFVCVDTSKEKDLFSARLFEHPEHQAFLDDAFSRRGQARWRIAFCHHPVHSAGPNHASPKGMQALRQRYIDAGIPVVFSGHEHNFQHWQADDTHHFVTGAAGKLSRQEPHAIDPRQTISWAASGHFIVATIRGAAMEVCPFGALNSGKELSLIERTVVQDGSKSSSAIVIALPGAAGTAAESARAI
jgi:hypothetical protein